MNRILSTTVFGAVLALAAAGCQRDHARADANVDRRPAPEGRLQVDESATLPVDVKAGVQREYPGAAVQSVSKRTYDDRVVRYEVHLTTKDGRSVTRVFDANGKSSDPVR